MIRPDSFQRPEKYLIGENVDPPCSAPIKILNPSTTLCYNASLLENELSFVGDSKILSAS